MMPYQGLPFFYVMGLMLLPAVAFGILEKPLRHYGLFFTAAMAAWVFAENGQLWLLAAFTAWQALLCLLYSRLRRGLWVAVGLAVLPLAIVKLGEVLPAVGGMHLLGISYMTFRSVQVLLDLNGGKLEKLSLPDLCYFLLFFPSVASGPIDRYRRFVGDLDRRLSREEYMELVRCGIWRLALGVLSAAMVSGLIWQRWLAPLPNGGFLPTLSYMYGYTFYLFFNFAGYSSMAIGTAYILGVSLPENFDMPFLSVDMKDFWGRWHISLSTWLRDYVYTRFVMASLKGKWFKNRRTASYLGYILNMLLMGAWHGLTPAYLLYGAYHGILMCANEALDLHWEPFKQFKRQGPGQIICVLLTFHLFSFGLLIFSGRLFG